MATPRVFISSTCYDLGQIRDSLSEFIYSYYFEPLLSEKGDVFFHPDLHTHESCINEVDNCQLFVLIIGGRFGGNYKYDTAKSITNAEYEAARIKKIPVFTFVKKDVFDDHKLYQKNKHNNKLVSQIEFPSIQSQEYAINIFEFINKVRLSDVNNGLYPFEFVRDIKNYLGKQWAGMMFDFLNNRSKDNYQKMVNNTLDNLTLINKKTEELLEGVVKKLSPIEGKKQIENIDKVLEGAKFFKHIFNMFRIDKLNKSKRAAIDIDPNNLEWFEYATHLMDVSLESNNGKIQGGRFRTVLYLNRKDPPITWSVKTEDNEYPGDVVIAIHLYEKLKQLNKAERIRALDIAASINSETEIQEEVFKSNGKKKAEGLKPTT